MNIVGRPMIRFCGDIVGLDHDSEIQISTMSVTGMFRRDAMLRKISETVALGNIKVGTIINTIK